MLTIIGSHEIRIRFILVGLPSAAQPLFVCFSLLILLQSSAPKTLIFRVYSTRYNKKRSSPLAANCLITKKPIRLGDPIRYELVARRNGDILFSILAHIGDRICVCDLLGLHAP